MPPGTSVRVSGRATGTLRVAGNLADEDGYPTIAGLRGTANFSSLTLQVEDIPLTATSPLIVKFQSNEVEFEKTQFTGPGTNIVFGGTAAIGPGGRQNLTVDGRLNLRVLNSLSPNNFFGGQADVAVRVFGTYETPRVTGTASIAGGSVAALVADERFNLTNVKGSLRFDANRVEIETLTGNLGGGKVVASGGAALNGLIPSQYRFVVHGENVSVPYPEGFTSTADANLEINGNTVRSVTSTIISGTVTLRRAQYTEDIELADLMSRRQEASLTEGIGESTLIATTRLDLRVEGRDALVVRNNLADLVGSVSLRINGSINEPVVSGRITVTRGTINFRNDRYEVTRALIDLPPGRGADPIINIQAEASIRGYQVIVGLSGPLTQPQATIRSDPALPQADVVSLITTGDLGSTSSSASVLGQSGFGTAASLITDTLINAPAQRATSKLFGINRFSIDPLVEGQGGSSPTARLTVGRQINKNLSITYSTNVTSVPNQVISLEYRVSNKLSFIARYEQGQTNNISTKNDIFSFEVRFQRRF
jgi:translocation and assembly module TamB